MCSRVLMRPQQRHEAGRVAGIDALICPSNVLPDRWRHTSEGTGIQCSMFGSWWTLWPKLGGESVGTEFWLLVLCLNQCCVGRSWTFHAKLHMRLLLFAVWGLYHRMWNDVRAGVLAAKGQRFFLFVSMLVMHASVLGTRTPISIQRRLGSALGCPVLVHLHQGSWRIFKSWRMTEAFLFPLARPV